MRRTSYVVTGSSSYLLLLVISFLLVINPTVAWISPSSKKVLIQPTQRTMTANPSSTTTSPPKPRLEIPPPICSTTEGTWAYDTMSRRVDAEILQRTYEDNQDEWEKPEFAKVLQRFQDLRTELQNAATTKLTYLDELTNDASEERQREWQEWHDILQPFVENNDTWLSAPWMVTEFYVYRRLMQAIGYWDKGTAGYMYDPFLKQKRAGLVSSVGSAEAMLGKIPNLPKTSEGIGIASSIALWGNKMDLSLWPADVEHANVDIFSSILEKAHENLLHDDTQALADLCAKLQAKGGGKVDIIVDNAGFELVTDLALAQHLIESGIASVVTFQLKSHPTFVSDALEKDLLETVQHYEDLDPAKFPNAQAAGALWRKFLNEDKWVCSENNFWVQAFSMWEMTEPLRTDMATRCDLAFVKGDANYRRLLGDCTWDYTAPFEDVVGCYFPCPVCALRTLKAELGCGMDADQVERAKGLDDNWMVNGRFGVVQLGKGAGNQ